MKTPIHTACLLLLATAFLSPAVAQNLDIRDYGLFSGRLASRESEHLEQLMSVHIEDMKHAVSLDDASARKLNLVAKVICQRLTDPEPIAKAFGIEGSNPAPTDDDDSFSDKDSEVKVKEDNTVFRRMILNRPEARKNSVFRDPSWKKAYSSSLSDEQKKQWAAASKKREKNIREAVAGYRTWHLAQHLNLDEKQIEAVKKNVLKYEASWLAKKINSKHLDFKIPRYPARGEKKLGAKDLQKILSEEQRKRYDDYLSKKSSFEPEALKALEPKDPARKQKLRQAVVQYRLVHFGQRLRLRDSQLESVAAVIDKVEGDALEKIILQKHGLFINGHQGFKSIKPADLEGILDENQEALLQFHLTSSYMLKDKLIVKLGTQPE